MEENTAPEVGVREEGRYQKVVIRPIYFHSVEVYGDFSKNVFAILTPNWWSTFFIKRTNKDKILLYNPKNDSVLKMWLDKNKQMLYTITSIEEPLFTHLYTPRLTLEYDFNVYNDSVIFSVSDSIDNNNTIDFEISDKVLMSLTVSDWQREALIYSLYHLYIKPII